MTRKKETLLQTNSSEQIQEHAKNHISPFFSHTDGIYLTTIMDANPTLLNYHTKQAFLKEILASSQPLFEVKTMNLPNSEQDHSRNQQDRIDIKESLQHLYNILNNEDTVSSFFHRYYPTDPTQQLQYIAVIQNAVRTEIQDALEHLPSDETLSKNIASLAELKTLDQQLAWLQNKKLLSANDLLACSTLPENDLFSILTTLLSGTFQQRLLTKRIPIKNVIQIANKYDIVKESNWDRCTQLFDFVNEHPIAYQYLILQNPENQLDFYKHFFLNNPLSKKDLNNLKPFLQIEMKDLPNRLLSTGHEMITMLRDSLQEQENSGIRFPMIKMGQASFRPNRINIKPNNTYPAGADKEQYSFDNSVVFAKEQIVSNSHFLDLWRIDGETLSEYVVRKLSNCKIDSNDLLHEKVKRRFFTHVAVVNNPDINPLSAAKHQLEFKIPPGGAYNKDNNDQEGEGYYVVLRLCAKVVGPGQLAEPDCYFIIVPEKLTNQGLTYLIGSEKIFSVSDADQKAELQALNVQCSQMSVPLQQAALVMQRKSQQEDKPYLLFTCIATAPKPVVRTDSDDSFRYTTGAGRHNKRVMPQRNCFIQGNVTTDDVHDTFDKTMSDSQCSDHSTLLHSCSRVTTVMPLQCSDTMHDGVRDPLSNDTSDEELSIDEQPNISSSSIQSHSQGNTAITHYAQDTLTANFDKTMSESQCSDHSTLLHSRSRVTTVMPLQFSDTMHDGVRGTKHIIKEVCFHIFTALPLQQKTLAQLAWDSKPENSNSLKAFVPKMLQAIKTCHQDRLESMIPEETYNKDWKPSANKGTDLQEHHNPQLKMVSISHDIDDINLRTSKITATASMLRSSSSPSINSIFNSPQATTTVNQSDNSSNDQLMDSRNTCK